MKKGINEEMKTEKVSVQLPSYNMIKTHLTYAEIQNIVNSALQFDTWAERQQSIDMLMLYYCTNMDQETIESISAEDWLESGEIEEIKSHIVNYKDVDEAIAWTESINHNLATFIKQSGPQIVSILKLMKKNGEVTTKK